MNKSLCAFPFSNIRVEPDGRIVPCCYYNSEGHKNHKSVKDAFFSEDWNVIRQKMLSGEKLDGCKRCYDDEGSAVKSYRQESFNVFPDFVVGQSPEIRGLDLSISNMCNLKCRACSSYSSNQWLQEDTDLPEELDRPKYDLSRINFDIEEHELKKIKVLNYSGGEPFLDARMNKFVLDIQKQGVVKNLEFEVNTNCTVFPSASFLEALEETSHSNIFLSIDGFGEHNEYIRNPSQWGLVEKIALQWLEYAKGKTNIKVIMNFTVNPYNILYIDRCLFWWYQLNSTRGMQAHMIFESVHTPTYMSPTILPERIKEVALEKLRNMIRSCSFDDEFKETIRNVEQRLQGALGQKRPQDFQKWKLFTEILDKNRKESFGNTFPELHKLLSEEFLGNALDSKVRTGLDRQSN